MPRHTTQAIVLHTSDFAEWDRIVSLFTRDFGRVKGIAKGAKRSQKRFGSALEPFTRVQADFVDREHRGLTRLERCRMLASFPEIALDIRKVAYGHYFLELVQTLTPEREVHADVFDLLVHFIDLLTRPDFREGLMRIFELRLFSMLGYQPQFQSCVKCERIFSLKDSYKFSIKQGGIVCARCQPRLADLLPLSNGTIRIFQQAQSLALLKLSRIFFSQTSQDEGRVIFSKFLEYHIGRRPKSLQILDQL